jgi:hypothetical protein
MSDSEPPKTREERLAAQLRENLKRRKAQGRARESIADAPLSKPDPNG